MPSILTSGFTLFEVLLSIAILSFVLLGMELMELSALRLNRNAHLVSVAELQIQNLEERLRVFALSTDLDQVIKIWNQENQAILPGGAGQVSGRYPHFSLRLYWGKQEAQSCEETIWKSSGCIKEELIL